MRIAQSMISGSVQKQIASNTERLFKSQEMISSGKKITRFSDDPQAMSQVMKYRKTLSSLDQYQRNISRGSSELELAESALIEVNDILIRAKELALAQNTGTASADTRRIAATELRQLRDQLVELANTRIDDRYVFGGLRTDVSPYDSADPSTGYQGDGKEFETIVGEGVVMTTNADGKLAFSRDVDTAMVLTELVEGLENNDTGVIDSQLSAIDMAINQAVDARADIGAKLNRMETTQLHWESVRYHIEKILSETEDVDITHAIADLNSQETAYQASLAVSARTFQQSLLDFLR